jgi:hypothetical protein
MFVAGSRVIRMDASRQVGYPDGLSLFRYPVKL